MEYPFKDLLPLDEVLAREGYYKDWTHLDPEVFYSLTQISEYIKTKGYGVDVRLLIAQLAEHFGLKTTQVVDLANLLSTKHDALKDQFDVVIRDATSGADWGGEIALARGGKPTLQARLDDTTEQLAQTVKKGGVKKQDFNTSSDAYLLDLNNFNEATRAVLQGLEPGQINAVVGRDNITAENAAFISKSSNLFNLNKIESGYVISSNGTKTANSSYNLSEYIPVLPNSEYTSKGVNHFAYYDNNYNFISRAEIGSGELEKMTRTTPSDAQYVRLSVQNSQIPVAQLNIGGELQPYEGFFTPYLSDSVTLKDKSVKYNHYADKSIAMTHTEFVSESTNLFNKKTALEGYLVSPADGEVAKAQDYHASDFIGVLEGESYISNGIYRTLFYDENKNYLSSRTSSAFTIPLNGHYIRLTMLNENVNIAQVNKGDTLLPYEDYYLTIRGIDLSRINNAGESEESDNDVSTFDYYVIDGKLDGVYTAPTMESGASGSSNSLWELTSANLYSLYDELVANYPEYVTKTQVGLDPLGNPLNRYDFTPNYPPKEQGTPEYFKRPKIFLVGGTHGNEKAGAWVLYESMKQICENWASDESLETLRHNVHFIVLPMANPSGWEANSRHNANGIDLNRQFPEKWTQSEPGTTSYGGTAPLTEQEAIVIADILVNEQDIIYFCDFHNFSPDTEKFLWNAGGTNFNMNISESLIMKLSRKWKKEIAELPQEDDAIFGYASPTPGGSMAKYAPTLGIQASTFEISERFITDTERYGALTIQLGVEAFVNWLILNVRNNIPLLNRRG